MYEIFRTSSFKKDYKKLSNSDKEIQKEVVTILVNGETYSTPKFNYFLLSLLPLLQYAHPLLNLAT